MIIDEKKVKESEQKIETNNKEIEKLKSVKQHLKDPEKKPFVWDIDFAEIFAEKNGFDIVIGNPPYVRQEMISPPNKLKSEVTTEDKKAYKNKLIESVKERFSVLKDLGKRSDYYIYFYFHGLSLLNDHGTFCFITSNSWLDVEYGKILQEFLCKYVPITAIYDNPKRSFTHADVNTIIALFGAPEAKQRSLGDWFNGVTGGNEKVWPNIRGVAKFVMFKKPFEEVLSSQNLVSIENVKVKEKGKEITDLVKNVVSTNDYRIFPTLQEDLLEDGWEYPENYKNGRFKSGSYEGNKWGGKYLRAPDIFYTILEKGEGNLVELGKIAKIRRGFTTGANEFFYLNEEAQKKWKIEKEFLKPIIKSPKECEGIIVDPIKLHFKVFICNKSKSELKYTNALNYIEWGENQTIEVKSGAGQGKKVKGYHKLETVKGRRLWYELPQLLSADILFRQFFNEIFNYPINSDNILTDHTFYYVSIKDKKDIPKFGFVLNSSLSWLFTELQGRKNMGEGVLTTYGPEMRSLIIFNPKTIQESSMKVFDKLCKRPVESVYKELNINPDKPIREQEPDPLPDRAELDNIIFDELGLTKEERKEVYRSVCELVKQRLDKARSLRE